MFVVSGTALGLQWSRYRQSEQLYRDLRAESWDTASAGSGEDTGGNRASQKDFSSLQAGSPDTVAWITGEDTPIDYPVMHTDNNEYYLSHLYSGEENRYGALFVDCRNTGLFTDPNTVIYGHNMKNGSIFGTLDSYKKADYWKEHPIVRFYVDGEPRTYEVFAAVETQVLYEDEDGFRYYRYDGDIPEEEYDELVTWLRGHSNYDTEIVPEYEDQILMLSTCSYHTKNGRFVVAARRVAEP